MPCPLFYQDSTSRNPLMVCGPRNRISYAPSSAHLTIFCLSVSAYKNCPSYKHKVTGWKGKVNRWVRFLKQVLLFLYR